MAQLLKELGGPDFLNNLNVVPDAIAERLREVNEVVARALPAALDDPLLKDSMLRSAINDAIYTKRDFDRAFFVRLGCECAAHNWATISPALLAAEFNYAADMILDDIVDAGQFRHGKACLHRRLGVEYALYVAEILRSMAPKGRDCLGLRRPPLQIANNDPLVPSLFSGPR